MTDIMEQIGLPALLEQLAEECTELAQAALKLARLRRGENPTPKTEQECIDSLTEEVADVMLCIRLIIEGYVIDPDKVNDIVEEKMQRWRERLEEAEEKLSAQPETNCSEIPNSSDTISRQAAIDEVVAWLKDRMSDKKNGKPLTDRIKDLPSAQPERKTGKWILDRSGAYCCSKCMEPCAGYVMMKPRDKFCKMCGAKMDGERKE